MAVTKIRKVTGGVLGATVLISIAIFALFFFGGSHVVGSGPTPEWAKAYSATEGVKLYKFIDLLMYWTYALVGLAVLSTLVFAVKGIVESFRRDARAAVVSVVGFLGLVALLFVTYTIGDATPIPGNDEGGFNVPVWLKMTDMWIYSTYVLVGLNVLVVLWSAVKGIFNK